MSHALPIRGVLRVDGETRRVRLPSGEEFRTTSPCCKGFTPFDGLEVIVHELQPHPLGGFKAIVVTLEPTHEDRHRSLLQDAALEHAALLQQHARESAKPEPPLKRVETHSRFKIDHSGDEELTELPDGLATGSLVLRGCTSLARLPRGLKVTFLDLDGCTSLERLPEDLSISVGRLSLRGCVKLTELPSGIGPLCQLDISDCPRITKLPDDLVVTSWIDVGGSGLRELSERLAGVSIRWRGVAVNERIAFGPDTLTAAEALADPNAERRRVMIERMGIERFMRDANAIAVDSDSDRGGTRTLLRAPLERDEELLCLSVCCPSTGRRYLLRVPPSMETCRAAAAWLAGFDEPADFEPQFET